jgi:tetratricopeptide (TPR) repeat protein
MEPRSGTHRHHLLTMRSFCNLLLAVFLTTCSPLWVHSDPYSTENTKLKILRIAAESAFKLGRYQLALSNYDRAARIAPRQSWVFSGRGITHEMLKKPAKAAKDYRKAIDLDPNNYHAMEKLAGLLERSGKNTTEAIDLYTRAFALDPRPEWKDNLPVWIEMLRTRLRPPYESAVGLWHLGNEKFLDGDLDAAESFFSKAIRLNPDMFQAFHSRGLVRLQKGHNTGAIEDFTQTIRISPRFPGIFVRRGLARQIIGESRQALSDFQKAVDLHQRDPEARYYLGRSLYNHRRFHEAVQSFNEGLRLKPSPDLKKLLIHGLAEARARATMSKSSPVPSRKSSKWLW